MRKAPPKKRGTRGLRPRRSVDPTRMALAALERIKTVLVKSGHPDRFGEPLSMKELAAQSRLLGAELPSSYVAAMRVAGRIGEPETFLRSSEMMAEAKRIVEAGGQEAQRYAPFCKGPEHVVCFDKGSSAQTSRAVAHTDELPIVAWHADGSATPIAANFGAWLDATADAREASVETAAEMPDRLKRLLHELGFRFDYPVLGRLETGDVEAIVALIGDELARTVRGDVDRLFDSSGKAPLTLDVDEFTLAATLRTGTYVFEAEDVFRWLRTFRDENFFSDVVTPPNHADAVRDLRSPPREAPLVRRGVIDVAVRPSTNLHFEAASGPSGDDFYLLGRVDGANERTPSIVLHVIDGAITTRHDVHEPLRDLYVARDGAMWGLTTTHAVRIGGGRAQSFPLQRPTHGRSWWHGIGGGGDRVLVWGNGALLEFDGQHFVPFQPDARLDEGESVRALHAQGLRIAMLVCGDRVGAVAHFDSVDWQPIAATQVIDAELTDLDVWQDSVHVLDRDGGLWRAEAGPPRRVALHTDHPAFLAETGAPRPLHGLRAYDGGLLFASIGGVLAVGTTDPVFHAIPKGRAPVRLLRVGASATTGAEARVRPALVALSGPNAWVWRDGQFDVIDARGG